MATPPGDRLPDQLIVRGSTDSYRIINLIGRGGMGVVYRVRRERDGSIWALKEMRPQQELGSEELAENLQLFRQEAELLAALNSPQIPAVIEQLVIEQRPALVMEFIPGKTLAHLLHDTGTALPQPTAVGYAAQLCSVLQYLHTRTPPIIYRDLKPANVMVTPDGALKLVDFGVARTHKSGKARDTVAMGSAGYAPPEQYGKGQTDARSDVYALGATLLHMLTGVPPIPLQPPQPGEISAANRTVTAAVELAVMRAMSLDRTQRYASAAELEQALRRAVPAAVTPPPAAPARPVAAVPTAAAPGTTRTAGQPAAGTQRMTGGQVRCPSCSRLNDAPARFCAGCGTTLTPESRRPHLLVTSRYRRWEVALGTAPLRIGRRDPERQHVPELDLAEHDRGIASRRHATIQLQGDEYLLIDHNSTNGTRVNGRPLTAQVPHRLRAGDRITIGDVEMEFRWN
jgi:tRNA A-37 threonylcarbamoyl transferase component Bud32